MAPLSFGMKTIKIGWVGTLSFSRMQFIYSYPFNEVYSRPTRILEKLVTTYVVHTISYLPPLFFLDRQDTNYNQLDPQSQKL